MSGETHKGSVRNPQTVKRMTTGVECSEMSRETKPGRKCQKKTIGDRGVSGCRRRHEGGVRNPHPVKRMTTRDRAESGEAHKGSVRKKPMSRG